MTNTRVPIETASRSKSIKNKRIVAICGIIILGVLYIYSLDTMQNCIHNESTRIEEKAPRDRHSTISTQFICAWKTIDANSNPIIAIFTIIAATFTGLLFWDGRDKAKKELRAYVAIGEKGLYSTVDNGIERPKMRIDNFGVTPAKNVNIWIKIVDTPPSFDTQECYSGGELLAQNVMIHPGQQLPLFWAGNMAQREGKFIFGFIEYSDIYNQKWKFRFAYQHRRHTWYTLHETHNDEIAITS